MLVTKRNVPEGKETTILADALSSMYLIRQLNTVFKSFLKIEKCNKPHKKTCFIINLFAMINKI
jgi:hypothetical protein